MSITELFNTSMQRIAWPLFLLPLLLLGCADSDFDQPPVGPEQSFSGDLQHLLDAQVDTMRLPGAILRVETPAGDVYTVHDGISEATTLDNVIEDGWRGARIPTNTLHTRIGSLTKSFTATLICLLVDDGLVALDSTVDTYLPNYTPAIPNADLITVRQLLDMTAGLVNYTNVPAFYNTLPPPYYTTEELIQFCIDGGGTSFDPGEGWEYSNTNYVVAGLIAEEITGQAYHTLVETRIMQPLGMTESSMPAPHDTTLPEPYWHGYSWDMPDGSLYDWTYQDPSWAWSAGMAISTVHDIAVWIQAVHRGTLLTAPTHAEMHNWVNVGGPMAGYGLGIARIMTEAGYYMYGHNGSMMGFETAAYVIEGYTITAITNGRPKQEWGFNHSADTIAFGVVSLLFE